MRITAPLVSTFQGSTMERYDWILLGIFVALAGGGLVGVLTTVPMEYGLAAGFLMATPFVYDAMFRSPPLPSDDFHRATAAIVWHLLLLVSMLLALV